ncbi:DUF58 domain-containing protein [Salinadaptatus halalkaliphilus]|uniref:DUF58 domain-containing protein n=1 Tax=Salinadaptatus halalkaliphilus TaxID=2419781 RepID=A0A4S3TMK7_9EURY|nr:DUF58 domain-containing protein [Salinadaptatus halalkaliphilus]THE64443.1 DUF58 domain-containing protein [Salinadaptatus halalkaliphilus]
MRPRRRAITTGVLVVFLASLAVVLARPLLLAGALLIGTWLLLRQYRFVSAVSTIDDSIAVDQTLETETVAPNGSVPVTLEVTVDQSPALALEAVAGLPVAANVERPLTVSIDRRERTGTAEMSVQWPVSGTHRFTGASVVAADELFSETITTGSTPTMTVSGYMSRISEITAAVDRVAVTMETSDAYRRESGFEPNELRQYTWGDTPSRIDWNVTARLGNLHIRDYESGTTRRTTLVVDHRATLSDGGPTNTKLDYLCEVALATNDDLQNAGDAIGLLTVGDGGLTTQLSTRSSQEQYETIRKQLLSIEPTTATDHVPHLSIGTWTGPERTDTDLRRRIEELERNEAGDAFASTLVPYYERQLTYEERFSDDPIVAAVKSMLIQGVTPNWTVFFTDDSYPVELYQAVKIARRGSTHVLVVLTPTVLFETWTDPDARTVYDRYTAFEEYRRSLAELDRVDAIEVGPTDRFNILLASIRGQRRRDGVVQ